WLANSAPSSVSELRQAFQHPPADARMMVRWWWFGPAVVRTELDREMRSMKDGGIGGFEVQPTYPMETEGNFKYLSPEFLDDLTYAGQRAKELGLRMDLTLGSGWPFGGPHIPIEEASGRLIVSTTPPKLAEGDHLIAAYQVPGNGRQFSLDEAHKIDPASAQGNVLYFVAGHTRQT